MAASLEIKNKFTVSSNRVKCVDQHPTEPWLLCALYNGEVTVWNYETTQPKVIKVCDKPVRAAKFISRKNWIVTASDDMLIRVFNYNTLEQEHAFEAHDDYIRSIGVHPTKPFILTSSDDHLIRLWNWEDNFTCDREFKGHNHYVMQVVFNPKDDNTFASASLDKAVKVWQLGASEPCFTMLGHEKGVNCVDYLGNGPYLGTGGDDGLVKIWDYQNRTCVRTLKLHTQNVTAVCYLSKLSVLLTASEDGIIGVWQTGTYRLESSLNYGSGRVWTVAHRHQSNQVAIGFDESAIIIIIGSEKPTVSMDTTSGKIICVKRLQIQQANLKTLANKTEKRDGETLPTIIKDMGLTEFTPKTVSHSPNGRFVAMCGEGEYIINTAVALRSKAFGVAQDFAWADNGDYAILTNCGSVQIFSNFEERARFQPEHVVSGIFGGRFLGVTCRSKNEICFYDWERLDIISRIEVVPRDVYWSENGELVCLIVENAYYVLRYETDRCSDVTREAFTSIGEMPEVVTSGVWVGDCFLYTDSLNRVKYFAGGEVSSVTVLDRPMYIIGYITEESRIYVTDGDLNIVTYNLPWSVLEYQTAVLRNELVLADRLLPNISTEHRTSIAQFLEKKSLKTRALAAATDPEHQFELALSLGELEKARLAAEKTDLGDSHLTNARWSRLGNAASTAGKFNLAETCYKKANNYSVLLLLAHCTGDKALLLDTANRAKEMGLKNIAFLAYFFLDSFHECLEMLLSESKLPKAALFARSYLPSLTSNVANIWKNSLTNIRAGQLIADPDQYANLFSEMNVL